MVNHEEGTRDESSQSGQITKMHAHTESYIVTPLGEQKMRKFNTNAKLLRPGNQQYMSNILQSLRRLFSSMIEDLTDIDTFKIFSISINVELVK